MKLFFVLQVNGDEGLILDQDAEGVNKDDLLTQLSESDPMATGEDDVTVLEETAALSPTADLSAAAPESGSESLPSAETCMKWAAAWWSFTVASCLLFPPPRLCGGGSVAGGCCADSCR